MSAERVYEILATANKKKQPWEKTEQFYFVCVVKTDKRHYYYYFYLVETYLFLVWHGLKSKKRPIRLIDKE